MVAGLGVPIFRVFTVVSILISVVPIFSVFLYSTLPSEKVDGIDYSGQLQLE